MTALLARSSGGGVGPEPGQAPQPPSDAEATLLGRPMPGDRLRALAVTVVLTAIGALVRLQNLGVPTDQGTPVFDEKHYVPQAWQMLRNGGYEDNYGYELVVHPPLAKQLIAVGEWLFGYDGWGWRFSAAIAGALIVLLTIRIARRLTRSTLLGAIAGILVISDGVLHLQSRMGMLDIFSALFVLAAFGSLLVDRDQVRQRLAVAVREGWVDESPYGPRLGFRWWRFGAGLLLGMATAVKWSGAYWVIAFGLLCIAFDVAARRTAGVRRPWVGVLRRDLAPAVWNIGALAVLVYLSSWWAWFASETATDRHYVEINNVGGGAFGFVPDALRSLVLYTLNVLDFHENLATPAGDPHPWESKPWTWPMGLRPMLYYYESGADVTGCGESECVSATMLIGTPAMWWLALPVLGWGLWRAVFRFDWRYAAVLVGYLAGLLPWFANLDRQMYFFYATPMAPFLVLGLTLVLGQLLGSARHGLERRGTGLLVVALYTGLVVANFVWLWPVLNGDPITNARWQAELWLPSWR
ncbi:dolichyl-phosphate-mannose--protein O-mannosyl transferase [Saccharomonospora marina XMU15]|uniref:Polyprenol-phosphate-mannose--protein mannosyltransferase n=1 Tax=Saccharomonospora marina XMU15 TaxID=882083 RepID=H5XBT9_9PSEU|nr:phospholipid carrier-dependent glycosyltransferase [Saccharomonospora marina]EHR52726.1 dolichyl-phosphate-mannose--protein O-mannosyl transferase [Saccharomonospora marina XMU15]